MMCTFTILYEADKFVLDLQQHHAIFLVFMKSLDDELL